MDTIGDFITRIRNASLAHQAAITVQWSRMRLAIARLLKEQGYVHDFKEGTTEEGHKTLVVVLKYVNGVPAITGIERHSKPGRRLYYQKRCLPKTLDGLGIGILTTSSGVMTDTEARRQNVGGELIFKVW
jgi:small subunit ribosomal protein S8